MGKVSFQQKVFYNCKFYIHINLLSSFAAMRDKKFYACQIKRNVMYDTFLKNCIEDLYQLL